MILSLGLFVGSFLVSGWIEGILYSRKGADAFKWNEHILYVVAGIIIGFLYVSANHEAYGMERFMVGVSAWFMFPLVHDASYFETRRFTDISTYRWYSYSTDRSNRIEFRPIVRICLASTGLTGLIIYSICH